MPPTFQVAIFMRMLPQQGPTSVGGSPREK
jgi:hypothetical protein